nr:hypothetical protein [Tanacetum cinerariifolium]
GPEEPEQAPPSPDYVPGPEHADDEIVIEDQPYAEDASPIAQSPEYEVGESSSAAAARPAGGLRADYGFVATVDREIVRDPESKGLAGGPTQSELPEEAGGSA